MPPIHKYPRTPHLAGSAYQNGDRDLDAEPWETLLGRFVVAEEKLDGANCAISFAEDGKLLLQSRGHFFNGSPRERQFDRFKQWAATHQPDFYDLLGDRYVLYGEWLYAKHTVFYDALPDYFHEFDLLDTRTGHFASTAVRREMLMGLPVVSVPVLFADTLEDPGQILSKIARSPYKSPDWKERLRQQAIDHGIDPYRAARETDPSDLMEGLYVKLEDETRVLGRFKYVRADFLNTIAQSETHWMRRPILPNVRADATPPRD